jgi:hypothetical protein
MLHHRRRRPPDAGIGIQNRRRAISGVGDCALRGRRTLAERSSGRADVQANADLIMQATTRRSSILAQPQTNTKGKYIFYIVFNSQHQRGSGNPDNTSRHARSQAIYLQCPIKNIIHSNNPARISRN